MPSMKSNKRVWREQDAEAEANVWSGDYRARAVQHLKNSVEGLKGWRGIPGMVYAEPEAKKGFEEAKNAQEMKGYAERARERKLKKKNIAAAREAIRSGKALEVRD